MTRRLFSVLALPFVLCAGMDAIAQDSDATNSTESRASDAGQVATLAVSDLRDFDAQPPVVQRLLARALALTQLNLAYHYGSSDPAGGGMDCSGTIYYLLREVGVPNVPRDSSEMYRWVWTAGWFHAVVSSSADTFELEKLRPGDLLFWTGTYDVKHDPPVSHVMIYLGINRHTGRRVMMGASEGRRFNGVSRYGVSVFDFTIPRPEDSGPQSRFIGYGAIPGLNSVSSDSPSSTDSQSR